MYSAKFPRSFQNLNLTNHHAVLHPHCAVPYSTLTCYTVLYCAVLWRRVFVAYRAGMSNTWVNNYTPFVSAWSSDPTADTLTKAEVSCLMHTRRCACVCPGVGSSLLQSLYLDVCYVSCGFYLKLVLVTLPPYVLASPLQIRTWPEQARRAVLPRLQQAVILAVWNGILSCNDCMFQPASKGIVSLLSATLQKSAVGLTSHGQSFLNVFKL